MSKIVNTEVTDEVAELDFIGTIKKSGNKLEGTDYPHFDDQDEENAYFESSVRMSKHDKEMMGYLDQLDAWLFMAGRRKHYSDGPKDNISVQEKAELEVAEQRIQKVLDRIDRMFGFDNTESTVLNRISCDI